MVSKPFIFYLYFFTGYIKHISQKRTKQNILTPHISTRHFFLEYFDQDIINLTHVNVYVHKYKSNNTENSIINNNKYKYYTFTKS